VGTIGDNSKIKQKELKGNILMRDLGSTSALFCKRILTILAYPLRAATARGVPRSDIASTSAPLERRNSTISEYPDKKKKKKGHNSITTLIVHEQNVLGQQSSNN
jgi:hypothetical protein